jgi:hypothetical protein
MAFLGSIYHVSKQIGIFFEIESDGVRRADANELAFADQR